MNKDFLFLIAGGAFIGCVGNSLGWGLLHMCIFSVLYGILYYPVKGFLKGLFSK